MPKTEAVRKLRVPMVMIAALGLGALATHDARGADIDLSCPSPWGGPLERVRIALDGTENAWCDVERVRSSVCTAFTAVGGAWWDARAVACSRPDRVCPVPWLVTGVRDLGNGLRGVEVPEGYEVVEISGDQAWLTPRGYPPTGDYNLSAKQVAAVEENLRMTFSEGGELSFKALDTVRRAFEDVYKTALLNDRARLRCSTRSCGTDIVAWWGFGRIRLCPTFFEVSPRWAASTLIEELMHGYAGIQHDLRPPVREADVYQGYLLAHYLD
jgi:hypothetical protein